MVSKGELVQITSIIIATLSSLTSGILFAWPSQAIPKLVHDNIVTLDEASYFVVLHALFMALFAPLFAYASNKIGRRRAMLVGALPQLAAWILTAFGGSVWVYHAARVMCGVADAGYYTVVPVFVGEIAAPHIRGTWGNSINFLSYFGSLVAIVVVYYCSIFASAVAFALIPLAFLVCVFFLPETPYYLLSKDRQVEAQQSLEFYRGSTDVADEFKQLQADVKRQLSESGGFKELVTIQSNRKSLIIGVFLRSSQQFSGISSFTVYVSYIFGMGVQNLPPSSSAMIYAGMLVATNLLAGFVLDKLGRRRAMLASCSTCCAILALESCYFYLSSSSTLNLDKYGFVPVLGLCGYLLCYSLGLGIMPSLMLGELFSSSVKEKCVCLMVICYGLTMGLSTKMFQLLMSHLGMYTSFAFFAGVCLVSTVLSYFVIPETSGRTLEEIQQNLKKN